MTNLSSIFRDGSYNMFRCQNPYINIIWKSTMSNLHFIVHKLTFNHCFALKNIWTWLQLNKVVHDSLHLGKNIILVPLCCISVRLISLVVLIIFPLNSHLMTHNFLILLFNAYSGVFMKGNDPVIWKRLPDYWKHQGNVLVFSLYFTYFH